ncbi:MAG: hypothetical protein WCX88_03530, partial [Patescibacteria group bacterium]
MGKFLVFILVAIVAADNFVLVGGPIFPGTSLSTGMSMTVDSEENIYVSFARDSFPIISQIATDMPDVWHPMVNPFSHPIVSRPFRMAMGGEFLYSLYPNPLTGGITCQRNGRGSMDPWLDFWSSPETSSVYGIKTHLLSGEVYIVYIVGEMACIAIESDGVWMLESLI